MATEAELSDFLRNVERRAFKRALYHVQNEESALDIVQDSMMKLAESYGDRPAAELPPLFQRILGNTVLDWFRRQKARRGVMMNMSELQAPGDDADFDLMETPLGIDSSALGEDAAAAVNRSQTLQHIESALQELPNRQREAFLLRYWEELDVEETAAAMGCSAGSVKQHCFRAVQALASLLRAKGIHL